MKSFQHIVQNRKKQSKQKFMAVRLLGCEGGDGGERGKGEWGEGVGKSGGKGGEWGMSTCN